MEKIVHRWCNLCQKTTDHFIALFDGKKIETCVECHARNEAQLAKKNPSAPH